jgi:hypothetical protein
MGQPLPPPYILCVRGASLNEHDAPEDTQQAQRWKDWVFNCLYAYVVDKRNGFLPAAVHHANQTFIDQAAGLWAKQMMVPVKTFSLLEPGYLPPPSARAGLSDRQIALITGKRDRDMIRDVDAVVLFRQTGVAALRSFTALVERRGKLGAVFEGPPPSPSSGKT